jgi:peptide/nickel transport system substrate-binding protein
MKITRLILPILLLATGLSACGAPADASGQSTAAAAPVESAPAQNAARTLTICLGYEPESLYLYAARSQAARDVLQAIYDGPFDYTDGETQPVILQSLPEIAYTQVAAQAGLKVVDTQGQVVSLQAGARVFPSGCRQADCAITWDGVSVLQLDQPRATYRLLGGLTWSDGQPLTAADSLYSYQIASDPATPGNKAALEQTESYRMLDETTLQWTGLPGLVTDTYTDYFWQPLPQHAWGKYSAAELLTVDASARRPLGWGAYVLDEWKAGEYIRLVKNPHYFRADEGLPKFDTLIFKVTDSYGDTNLANLKFDRKPYAQFKFDLGEYQGEIDQNGCDLISSTVDMSDQFDVLHILLQYFSDPAVKVSAAPQGRAAWLLFNRREDANGEKALFDNRSMRQAAAACLERGELAETVFHNLVQTPDAFTFDGRGGAQIPNAALAPDPARGNALLEENGWRAGEPRTASGITGLPNGTPLAIHYLVENDAGSLAAAQQVKASLTECGFQVNIIAVAPQVYWNQEAAQSIFQGNWDLAQVNWIVPADHPCPLVESADISKAENQSAGLNFSGLADARVDELCRQWAETPLAADRQTLIKEMESILNQDLAIIPLYTYNNLLVSRDDFCAFQSGRLSDLSGIESFDYGTDCLP